MVTLLKSKWHCIATIRSRQMARCHGIRGPSLALPGRLRASAAAVMYHTWSRYWRKISQVQGLLIGDIQLRRIHNSAQKLSMHHATGSNAEYGETSTWPASPLAPAQSIGLILKEPHLQNWRGSEKLPPCGIRAFILSPIQIGGVLVLWISPIWTPRTGMFILRTGSS